MSSRKKSAPSGSAGIELTRRALSDLREIERYSIQEWGRRAAGKYLDDIAAALDRLSLDPNILRLEPAVVPGLFLYRVKKHFLICDFDGQTVIILTVIHTSMDVPSRLLELEPRLLVEVQLLRSKLRRKMDDV